MFPPKLIIGMGTPNLLPILNKLILTFNGPNIQQNIGYFLGFLLTVAILHHNRKKRLIIQHSRVIPQVLLKKSSIDHKITVLNHGSVVDRTQPVDFTQELFC